MKSTTLYISLLLVLSKGNLNAQCVENADFAQYCNSTINISGFCPTFDDNCVPHWIRSHGSPEVFWVNFENNPSYNQANKPQWNVMYMWANLDADENRYRGEGIITGYNFVQNYTYKIVVKYKVFLENPAGSSNAEFRLVASQNLHRPTTWRCGNLIPWTEGEQQIAVITDKNTDWKTSAVYTYTPTSDYNQFWIYPYTTTANQYNLYVDWVYVCRDECESSFYYNTGVIPTGGPKFGYIYVGSSYGGSGTVTVSSTATTVLTAAKEINFKPDFQATVTSGSFTARIENCTTNPSVRAQGSEDSTVSGLPTEDISGIDWGETEYTDEYEDYQGGGFRVSRPSNNNVIENVTDATRLKIYPNPAQDKLNMDVLAEKKGEISIRIINSLGVTVKNIYSATTSSGKTHFEVDIERLPSGYYLVQVINAEGKISVKKIQKIK